MKKAVFTLSILIMIFFGLSAQEVFEQDRPMSLGMKPAHVILLQMNDVRDIEKMWDDYMREMGIKMKRNRKADEYFSEESELYSIGKGNTFNLYSRIQEQGDGAEIMVWVDLGSEFLTTSDNPSESKGLTEILLGFEKEVRIEKVRRELESEEDRLKEMNKDLENLVSDNERFHENIEDAKKEIKENEKNIENNLKEQESSKKKIKEQKVLMEAIKKRMEAIQAE
jgi:hypothetical protein